jgi:predicted Zn-dependent protease
MGNLMTSATEIRNKIRNLISQKKFAEAENCIDQYEKANPHEAEMQAVKADLLICEGKLAEAEFITKQGLKIESANLTLNYLYAAIAEKTGNIARQLSIFKNVLLYQLMGNCIAKFSRK